MTSDTYLQILFKNLNAEKSALLIALLEAEGFEGFEEEDENLKAYVTESAFAEKALTAIAQQHNAAYSITSIKPQNWNALWEQNFEPVIIEDFAGIRAGFHEPVKNIKHEIIITPKMSFGTGHHATTYMMIIQMQRIDFTKKKVFDFGTGTGILAILAEKLGAINITAADIDAWSIENASENILLNNCTHIVVQQNDTAHQQETFDIILANINKNIILNNFGLLKDSLRKDGLLLLSGLLAEDEPDILFEASKLNMMHVNTINRQQWISMLFRAVKI